MIKGGWGWTRIQRVTLVGPEGQLEVTPTLLWQAPDDDNPEDRTVFSVKLPRPVAPGESIRVDVEWESQLPRVRRRTAGATAARAARLPVRRCGRARRKRPPG